MGCQSSPSELDVLVVGAGFSGIYMLKELRSLGFSVILHEAGGDMGGTWYWNNYPGARVDSEFYIYQLSDPKLWEDFDYNERFPGREELIRYFHHVDKVLGLSKDIRFNTKVIRAEWLDERNLWKVTSKNDGMEIINFARHLVLCTGFAAKVYTPDFKGLDKFKGEVYHSSLWPKSKPVSLSGKKIAVVGTGASGIQISQEVGPIANHLTVYQRTPNLALPMRQCPLPNPQEVQKSDFASWFVKARSAFGGLKHDFLLVNATESTPEFVKEHYEKLWAEGGFAFWLGTFQDVYFVQEANDTAYNFWVEKTRKRITNEKKRDILAPLKAPHGFGLKRPSLEQRFYEVMNQDNVDIIDVNKSPILEITEKGIKTQEEGEREVDILILATGFDSVTGGILNIEIINGAGLSIQQKWKGGTSTYLGLTTAGFPNMYFLYGPQAPTAFSNGPTCGVIQGEWIIRLMTHMRKEGKAKFEVQSEAEMKWVEKVHGAWNISLFPQAKGWYQGSNIPGKVVEPLNYAGGIPTYTQELADCEKDSYAGLNFA